jgi:hypothetical protein
MEYYFRVYPQSPNPKTTPCTAGKPCSSRAGTTPNPNSRGDEAPEPPTPPCTRSDLLTAEQQNLTLYLQNVQGISGNSKNACKAASKRAELKQMIHSTGDGQPHLVVLTDHK